jgi:hypothetical protein
MPSSCSHPRFFTGRKLPVPALLTLVLAAGLLTGGCASTAANRDVALFTSVAPLPVIVAPGTELAQAERAAARQPGCLAVRGEGGSMEPVYPGGTAVVIRVGGYEHLRCGLPVVYRSRRGISVAHMLVRQTPGGWIARGLDNNAPDEERVTADNLVGIITQAYASKTGSLPRAVAARIALNRQLREGVALAVAGDR